MNHRSRSLVLMVALLGLCAVVQAENDWHWRWPQLLLSSSVNCRITLTENSGARAMAFGTFRDTGRAAVTFDIGGHAHALCIFDGVPQIEEQPSGASCVGKASIAVSFGADDPQKHALWPSPGLENSTVEYADTSLTTIVPNQNPWGDVRAWETNDAWIDDVAIAATHDNNHDYVCVCYYGENRDTSLFID